MTDWNRVNELAEEINNKIDSELKYDFRVAGDGDTAGLAIVDMTLFGRKYRSKCARTTCDAQIAHEKCERILVNVEHFNNWLRLARLIEHREHTFVMDEWYITVNRGTETMRMYADGETYKAVVTKVGVEEVSYGLDYEEAHKAMTHFLTKSQYV